MRRVIIFAIVLVYAVPFTVANGAGNEMEKTVNGFSFEFGLDPKYPKANERVIMSLSIHNASTGEALKIDDLWIRISKGNEILFTSSDFRIAAKGPVFFGYTFKENGDYTIDFSFKQDYGDIKTSFDVSIKKGYTAIFGISIALLLAFVLGYAAAGMAKKRKNNKV